MLRKATKIIVIINIFIQILFALFERECSIHWIEIVRVGILGICGLYLNFLSGITAICAIVSAIRDSVRNGKISWEDVMIFLASIQHLVYRWYFIAMQ